MSLKKPALKFNTFLLTLNNLIWLCISAVSMILELNDNPLKLKKSTMNNLKTL